MTQKKIITLKKDLYIKSILIIQTIIYGSSLRVIATLDDL